ncbi:MAG: WecB/TagA/CpsF family glycosyltransferase [Bacteroidales bacterium]|nr:WecB/TagA/CpsF family glycosyltransferase [Bacteroidales bacterium]
MTRLADLNLVPSMEALRELPEGKMLINTVNAWSWVVAGRDGEFARSLKECDALIPDGISIVKACRFLNLPGAPKERIAGADLFAMEMEKLNRRGGRCFFLGSSETVLSKIVAKAAEVYPNVVVETYSPPYKAQFSPEDDAAMIAAVNAADPDLLWIGMTAPKQEKWAFGHWDSLNIRCHCGTIGAVFDFFAGTVERAPEKWQKAGFEWLYRLLKEPRRMWRRYIVGNVKFIFAVLKEKHGKSN